jgi:aminoglycoside phosphotransferase (APT) family kinase protein
MSAVPATGSDVAPSDERLAEVLRDVLARAGAGEPASVRRSRSIYRSSFPLEELEVTLSDGRELRLALKRLELGGLNRDGRLAKPDFLFDAGREAAVYSSILPAAPAGPPAYFGSLPAEADGGCWLFIEWVDGRELYQVGELAVWVQVARWLGDLHASLAGDLERHALEGRLIDYDAAHYRRWLTRAREHARLAGRSGDGARFLDWLALRHDAPVDTLLALDRTVLHGDFFASNVLVAGDEQAVRVAPVDWELAAAGPGLMDLAALISGDWTEAQRGEMSDAYASRAGIAPFSAAQLDCARLQLAVQWLGWATPEWVAPAGQRHDWLGDAVALAERLEL